MWKKLYIKFHAFETLEILKKCRLLWYFNCFQMVINNCSVICWIENRYLYGRVLYKYIHHKRLIKELYLFWLFITLIQLLVELAGQIKPSTFWRSNRFSFNCISPVIIETVELQFHSCKNQRVTVTVFFSTVLIFYLKIFTKSAKKEKKEY